uniref:SAM-dependent MTase RsmB/NOP-type domain-containing protein n=1 Tax=Capra hircus TaxID=9925 RepID=A0A8C2S130_CAPHI
MSVFPKISLKLEVENYLKAGFMNKEILSALGKQEAERRFETLLHNLSHPPSFTTVRVNTHLASVQHVKNLLFDELQKQFNGLSFPILQHPDLQDVLLIPVIGPRKNIKQQPCEVIVGAQCGNAVLRGAHVFVPGIVSASKFMKGGDHVSVYSDIKGKCKKGQYWSGLFPFFRGVGVRMTEPVYLSPSFDNNLPSAVVSHVLDPQPGEKVLDLCAAPGGKTTHIATLMRDQGEVIALDKISKKVEKIKQNALLLGLNSIRAFCFDGTKALKLDMIKDTDGEPPFLPESFDRILLDAPCSGMGQRPNMACTWTLKEVMSYQPLQRKLFTVAVELLKPGGVLVYSTCTVTLAENEEQVAWALETFPGLQLQHQDPQVGGEGMLGAGLSPEQLKRLQRFDPSAMRSLDRDIGSLRDASIEDLVWLANKDCIGFFIAKFVKCKSAQ